MTPAKPCIAVVDDEGPVRTMLRRVLRLAGYDVVEFATGDAFLASVAAQRADCAVLDVHMPGLSGLEVHQRLGAMRKRMPVVFITASDDPGITSTVAREHGAVLLRKPFPSDDLLDAVATAIRGTARDDDA